MRPIDAFHKQFVKSALGTSISELLTANGKINIPQETENCLLFGVYLYSGNKSCGGEEEKRHNLIQFALLINEIMQIYLLKMSLISRTKGIINPRAILIKENAPSSPFPNCLNLF